MTAIAGLIRLDGGAVDAATLARMQAVLTPYGQDAQDLQQLPDAGFVRTLLRTTPEDSLDQQPLHHAASQTWLLFDGRLDNREELARELGLAPPELARLADSALVLRACLRWDTGAVERLVGDFALACWQAARRRLWLARDPMGKRPLFWHQQPDFFAFSTMPKGLFAIPGVPRALSEERLHDYLCLRPLVGPQSFFKDIYKVEPGQWLAVEDGKTHGQRYHSFDPDRELSLASDEDYVEALSEQLQQAVSCRLRSCGRVASHLSSGFDSSTVTALAARELQLQGQGLLAYTAVPRAGFDGPVPPGRHADESTGAVAVAARYPNIEHHLIHTGVSSPLDGLAASVAVLDRAPLNPGNMVWLEAIQRDAAARGAKVLLTGQLGNITISHGGEQRLAALLGRGEWLTWWREASAMRGQDAGRSWRGLLATSLGPFLPREVWNAQARLRGRQPGLATYAPLHPEFDARMKARQPAPSLQWGLGTRPVKNGRRLRIAGLGRLDGAEHTAGVNAMGLELRDPTADRRLVEFCLALPDHLLLRDGQNKWLLRQMVRDLLPPEVTQARSKGLQAADWYEAATAARPQFSDAVHRLARHEGASRYLDVKALLDALEQWPEEGWWSPATQATYQLKLLRGLSVGQFIQYVDGGDP
jgi:asparagine synthase (glutamine-hydrolysing)